MAPAEFVAWPGATDAERAMKSPVVEKDAGAEIIEWRVRVVDELLGDNRELQRVLYHYIRIKVFNEKGKEKTATIDLPYREPGAILDVAGRTIKPDGSILELDRKTVYKRDILRAGSLKEKAVSFAMPGVEPGAILEYRWRQTEDDNRFKYLRIHFQREFPVQKVTWYVKPLPREAGQMVLMPLNSRPTPFAEGRDGFNYTVVENVPAERTEPYAPSKPNREPWALLYYTDSLPKDADKYWNDEGKKTYRDAKLAIKSSDEIKAAAAEAIAGAKSEDEKASGLAMAVRHKVRNLFSDDVTSAEVGNYFAKLPKDRPRTAPEIFRSGIGTPNEMTVVFVAMAEQAGIEARPVLVSSRDEVRFNPKVLRDTYFIDDHAAAVRSGTTWKVINVSDKFSDPLTLPWEQEGTFALVCDGKEPMFILTPPASPENSTELRTAQLKLSADGTLEGDVTETISGHRAADLRREKGKKSAAQREEGVHDLLVKMFPEGDVTDIKVENMDDATKPVIERYHLRAPLFAQSTGKRILFQPMAFRRTQASPFTASERKLPIEFPYAWKEIDRISIVLPDGFALDNADSPSPLNFGKPGSYNIRMTIKTKPGAPAELGAEREFVFGNDGNIFFGPEAYPTLKKVFDEVETRDGHTLSLKAK